MLTIPSNIFKMRHSKRQENRLYIAYYYRTPTPSNPVRYHTALVVIPTVGPDSKSDSEAASECDSSAPPSPSSSSPASPFGSLRSHNHASTHSPSHRNASPTKAKEATKFHVVNVPVNEGGHGRVVWSYRVESEYTYKPGTGLRARLACLMFVGSVPASSKVEKILAKVRTNKYADEFPDYVCTTWIDEALLMLVDDKIIDSLPCPPAEFWEIGAHYADQWKEGHGSQVECDMAIPCCDRHGNEFPTPLGVSRQ